MTICKLFQLFVVTFNFRPQHIRLQCFTGLNSPLRQREQVTSISIFQCRRSPYLGENLSQKYNRQSYLLLPYILTFPSTVQRIRKPLYFRLRPTMPFSLCHRSREQQATLRLLIGVAQNECKGPFRAKMVANAHSFREKSARAVLSILTNMTGHAV